MEEHKLDLSDTANISLEPEESVKGFGTTLVVAPHPDDESLGCGGAVALLRKYGCDVSILVLSDGTLSHPNSIKYPPDKLRELRETELLKAAHILDVNPENITFFRYRDRGVPDRNSAEFAATVERYRELLERSRVHTIFVPWRRDPHPDHQAAFQLIDAAKTANQQIIEYPIWLYELAQSEDAPLKSEVTAFRLDVASVNEIKQQAIRAHASQLTDLIDDDPGGFRLSEGVLENFAAPFETYLRAIKQ